MTAPAIPPVGSVLADRYRVEGAIGAGGMGVVLRATDLSTGGAVALKVLSADSVASSESVARFELEVRAMSKVASEHVVTVLDAGRTEEGLPFLAMELLEGEDVAAMLDRCGRLPREEAVGLILQACAGVAAAHAAGVVHRDLKPANLFLAQRVGAAPLLKILDFGLTKILSSGVRLTLTATTIGTPMYMAPEQIASSKSVDARCDQHALGMILYELLTGRPPYDFDNPGKLVVAIVTHPVPSPRVLLPDLPLPLDRAIRRALAKSPDDRFPDVGQFARALESYAAPGARELVRLIESTLSAALGGDAESTATIEIPQASPHLSSFEMGPTEQIVFDAEGRRRPRAALAARASAPAGAVRASAGSGRAWRLLLLGIGVGVIVMGVATSLALGVFDPPPSPTQVSADGSSRAGHPDTSDHAGPADDSLGLVGANPLGGGTSPAPTTGAAPSPSTPTLGSSSAAVSSASTRPSASAPPAVPPRGRTRRPVDPLRQYD